MRQKLAFTDTAVHIKLRSVSRFAKSACRNIIFIIVVEANSESVESDVRRWQN